MLISKLILFPESDINMKKISFVRIINSTLVTSFENMSLTGQPKIVDGQNGGYAIYLNTDQCITAGQFFSDCFKERSFKCPLGLTIKFSLKLVSLKNKAYILSTGEDPTTAVGISMYYLRKKLFLTVSTSQRQWIVYKRMKKSKAFSDFEISWSKTSGLSMVIDNKIKVAANKYRIRSAVKPVFRSLKFNCPHNNKWGTSSTIILGGLRIWEAEKRILNILEIVTGKDYDSLIDIVACIFIYLLIYPYCKKDNRYEIDI